MKTTGNVIKENLLALVISFILAFSIAFLISKVNFLKADIMGVKNQDDTVMDVDFVVNKTNKCFEVISNKNFEGVQGVVFDILYDSKNVEIKDDNILLDDYSFTTIDTGHIEIVVNNLGTIKKGQKLIILTGVKSSYINLGGLQFLFTDGSLQSAFQIKIK